MKPCETEECSKTLFIIVQDSRAAAWNARWRLTLPRSSTKFKVKLSFLFHHATWVFATVTPRGQMQNTSKERNAAKTHKTKGKLILKKQKKTKQNRSWINRNKYNINSEKTKVQVLLGSQKCDGNQNTAKNCSQPHKIIGFISAVRDKRMQVMRVLIL